MEYENWGEKPVPTIDPESEPYWEAASEGELAIQHCADCGEHQFYPRKLCRHCWSRNLEFERLDGDGEIYSFTICHTAGQPGYGEETPYAVALVELELPSENPSGRPVRMTSHVVGCEDDELEIGLAVTATFRRISEEPEVHLPVYRPRE